MRVFLSRFTPGLKPGDGDKIDWEIGEVVQLVNCTKDTSYNGKLFKVLSEGMSHDKCPLGLVREGYFLDDRSQTREAVAEIRLWFTDGNYNPMEF